MRWLVKQWGVRVSVGSTAPWLREVESRVARRRARSTRVPPALQRGWTAVLPGRGFGVRAPAERELSTFGDLEVRRLCGVGSGGGAGVWGPQAFRGYLVSTANHLGWSHLSIFWCL